MGPLLVAWFPWFPMKEDEIGAAGSLAKGNGYQPLPGYKTANETASACIPKNEENRLISSPLTRVKKLFCSIR
jgi:hypothetical protein